MTDPPPPLAIYRERAARFAAERDRLAARSRRISIGRLLVFAGALAAFIRAETAPAGAGAFTLAGCIAILAFLALVVLHSRNGRAHRRAEALVHVNEEAQRRLARDWDGLPDADLAGPGAEHAYAVDLDVFGRASLFQLLGTAATAPGRATLRDWLLSPAEPAEIRERQTAIAELAPMLDLRDALAADARVGGRAAPEQLERFLRWAEGEPWLLQRPLRIWAARLLPVATVAAIIADATGAVAAPLWILTIGAGLLLARSASARVHATFGRAFAHESAFRSYAGLLRLLAEAPFRAPRLRAIQAELSAGGLTAHRWMRRLERIMELADTRFSLAHFIVQPLLLWDLHVLVALERWQRTAGTRARRWIHALGAAEALAALAALKHGHPDWAFPDVVEDGAPVLEAAGLGHPLLPPDSCIANDVTLGPPGTFLLVTGSNMSGKSTLLRAVGTNVVLAQAGGPVCASVMRMPPVAVFTSMRLTDSLEQGVSYFMAELRRLKRIVDAAREAERTGGRTLLYLLDEILHGTNTAERKVAARRVIAFLVERGAIGAVSTHDLSLGAGEELAGAVRPVHFTERVHGDDGDGGDGNAAMSFDYLLRPGVATSTNALRLMEIVGLGLEGAGAATRAGG